MTKIKNSVVEEAEKWYIELRDSGAKYIAVYKERLDSLLSYQKKLHELCESESSPELVLRAISELHKIEMSLHTLMKELPGDIKTSEDSFDVVHRSLKMQYRLYLFNSALSNDVST